MTTPFDGAFGGDDVDPRDPDRDALEREEEEAWDEWEREEWSELDE